MGFTVNWIKNSTTYITAEEMNELLDRLRKDKKLKEIEFYTFKRAEACYRTFCVGVSKTDVCVRIVYDFRRIESYTFSASDTGHNRTGLAITGTQAYDYVDTEFRSLYGLSIFQAFSGMKYDKEYREIKNCVPKQISMIDKFAIGIKIKNCYKADVSSAYPYEGTKDLPTLKDCIRKPGTIKPTEEYPFAFYIKSNHSAVLNEYDTHEWLYCKKYYTLYDKMFNDILPSQDETILCKKSKYSLVNVFNTIYNRKTKGDNVAKLGMNACIGYFQKNTNPKLSHLASVIIGRCCQRMIDTAKDLEKEGNRVLFIATDSLVWTGSESNIATDEKYIGSFTYECKNSLFYGLGPKAYQILNRSNGKVITKYAGMENGPVKESMEFGKLPKLKTEINYCIDNNGHIMTVDWIPNGK